MKQPKLNWQALVNLYLWHAYPKDALITDDTAYVSALHIRDFCNDTIKAIAVSIDADTEPGSEGE